MPLFVLPRRNSSAGWKSVTSIAFYLIKTQEEKEKSKNDGGAAFFNLLSENANRSRLKLPAKTQTFCAKIAASRSHSTKAFFAYMYLTPAYMPRCRKAGAISFGIISFPLKEQYYDENAEWLRLYLLQKKVKPFRFSQYRFCMQAARFHEKTPACRMQKMQICPGPKESLVLTISFNIEVSVAYKNHRRNDLATKNARFKGRTGWFPIIWQNSTVSITKLLLCFGSFARSKERKTCFAIFLVKERFLLH